MEYGKGSKTTKGFLILGITIMGVLIAYNLITKLG